MDDILQSPFFIARFISVMCSFVALDTSDGVYYKVFFYPILDGSVDSGELPLFGV